MAITVLLRAGLGNQMLQFALGRRLALHHATPLLLATHWYDTSAGSHRTFELDRFVLANDPHIQITSEPWETLTAKCSKVYSEPKMGFCPEAIELPSDVALLGWFGSWRYFDAIALQIREDFKISDQARVEQSIAQLRRPNRVLVSIHVRRGDYLKIRPDGELVVGMDRIRRAMSRFDSADFLVFSDDLAWCRENISGPDVRFTPFNQAVDDLTAMSLCDHHIIANSTFSWWGAWLNPNPNKQVLFPRNWHDGKWPNVGPDPAEKEVALPEWIEY